MEAESGHHVTVQDSLPQCTVHIHFSCFTLVPAGDFAQSLVEKALSSVRSSLALIHVTLAKASGDQSPRIASSKLRLRGCML